MTLGEYPEKVPPRYLIPAGSVRSKLDLGRFENVAPPAGLTARGPDLAGGSIFDDFNGDGRPDIFTTSFDVAHRRLAVSQPRGRHVRGPFGQGGPGRPGLRAECRRAPTTTTTATSTSCCCGAAGRSRRGSRCCGTSGDGAFEDVTVAAGLAEPIATESAAWGDYDDDGQLDLFVCGEYLPPDRTSGDCPAPTPGITAGCITTGATAPSSTSPSRPGSATIVGQGSAWGDYDNDGRLDLFVSNMDGPGRLYHNRGDGTFVRRRPRAGHRRGRPWLRLLVLGLRQRRPARPVSSATTAAAWPTTVADYLGLPVSDEGRPRLYHNLGPDGLPRRQPRGRAGPRDARDVDEFRRPRQRRIPRPPLRHRLDVVSGLVPDLMLRERRRPALRGRDRVHRDRPPPEGTRHLHGRLRRRRRSRPLRRPGRRLPRATADTMPCSATPATAGTG